MSTETIAPKAPEAQAERLGEPWTDAALRAELQKGVDELDAGRGIPWDEFKQDLMRRREARRDG